TTEIKESTGSGRPWHAHHDRYTAEQRRPGNSPGARRQEAQKAEPERAGCSKRFRRRARQGTVSPAIFPKTGRFGRRRQKSSLLALSANSFPSSGILNGAIRHDRALGGWCATSHPDEAHLAPRRPIARNSRDALSACRGVVR